MDKQSQSRINYTPLQIDYDTTHERLAQLLKANSEIEKQKRMFRSDAERRDAEMMLRPMDVKQVLSGFGLLLGTLPPAAILAKMFMLSPGGARLPWIIPILIVLLNVTTAAVGYFSGKVAAILVEKVERASLSRIALLTPLIGFGWGAVCGAAGGVFMLIIGAFFGAFIGGFVGAVALPIFVFFHLLLKRGNLIDRRHFLPVAFGITLTICALPLVLTGTIWSLKDLLNAAKDVGSTTRTIR